MWKDYSSGYLKNNRASGMSIMVAAFIATLFLSFLCSLFYNFWQDDIAGIILEDGDWQGRIVGSISEEDIAVINHFANVEKAVINEDLSGAQEVVVDICFHNVRTILQDMPSIINMLGLNENAVTYNFQLLSMYFIRVPGDEAPRLLMPFYTGLVVVVCLSMILVIHNSFAVSMNSRIHQFGIFSSIGATPVQIRTCLMQETVILSLTPVLAGILSGIVLSFGAIQAMKVIAVNVAGSRGISFSYHPVIFAITFLSSAFTVLFSAWLPARKLSRLTPLEAIRGTDELQLKKKKHSPILSTLFGMEGELAGNAMKAQKKAMRTTSLSLTLSFLGFMVLQCFFTLSDISTNHTYFERYQDAWDVMVTVKDTAIVEFEPIEKIQGTPGVRSSIVYQKAEAISIVPKEWQSEELLALGGLETVAGSSVSVRESSFLTKVSIVIMDDKSFTEYCEQIGISPGQDGIVLINRIWDRINSNFRYPKYVPYVKENKNSITLQNTGGDRNPIELPVLAYTQKFPALREEYANYALVSFIPLSLWKEIAGQIGGSEKDAYVRLLANEDAALDELNVLEENAIQLIGRNYEIESENRIQEKITNDEIIGGYKLVLGAFCILLAIIGIANVFSNTLGFLRQRKREFARYISVGLTPEGIRKMFCIEALVIAGRPVLITLPLTIVAMGFMITASYLDPMEFIAVAPIVPILVFVLAVFGFVALAYYLGGKRVFKASLTDALRDDTMM